MKAELKLTITKSGELTPQMARAVVALGQLHLEEGEQSVWKVVKTHYEINHEVKVVKLCNYCLWTGLDAEGEHDEVVERDCPKCEGKGWKE